MSEVWAKNKAGVKMKFTKISWDLLGANKEGWELMPDHVIHNVTEKMPMAKPLTGEKKKQVEQKIENVTPKIEVKEFVMIEEAGDISEEAIKIVKERLEISEQQKTLFYQTANGIKAGTIKDFFEDKNIDFKAGTPYKELLNLLGKHFNFDVIELQKSFGK